MSAPLLALSAVTKRFGGVTALDHVSFDLAEGELVGLIGPNGAGKTTLLNCLSRLYRLDGGSIRFSGMDIAKLGRHEVARLGVGRTFQVVRPFRSMTARENVAIGALFGSDRARLPPREAFRVADEVIDLVGLGGRGHLLVDELTVPDRRHLEVARALATRPRLLLLDEVMAGLNPSEVAEALEVVKRIHASGIAILVIEHVMQVIVGICPRVVVLHFGKVLLEGDPSTVLKDPRVVEAYLGERYARRVRGSRGDG
ncbi:MAG: ABC transporter ATP-binding protein [Chloroflexota bacterium]|nr:ABC transporter ATP-binding protein [Chloroflexota bacterium]MDE3192270.1 ABC transporter ATP-binding protein [Chloroflexota bacterium]